VTFRTKNGKSITLPAQDFLARFVQHVLPAGFVKIRHYGLMAPRHATTTLQTARQILNRSRPPETHDAPPMAKPPGLDANLAWREWLRVLTGIDVRRCCACGAMAVVRRPLPLHARAPPEAA
jgi:Putative transposase